MDQHQIPKQITTFEFKLIGFLTLKQFLYIIFFSAFGILIYLLVSIPYINIFLSLLIGSIGFAFAFIRINERPLDIFIKNLLTRLTSPSQYYYKKDNKPPQFMDDVPPTDPLVVNTYIDAHKKIEDYLQKTGVKTAPSVIKEKSTVDVVSPIDTGFKTKEDKAPEKSQVIEINKANTGEEPFLSGTVLNSTGLKLPNIMVYIKDSKGTPLRMLKTDGKGIFTTHRPIPDGSYLIEARDTSGNFFFDTIKLEINSSGLLQPVNIVSKETI